MCLIFIAHHRHPRYPLVVAANRDEFHARPTASVDWWEDAPEVLAGRDLQAGGTWLGITRSGRFAALTNYREPGKQRREAPTRGHLVSDFLRGVERPADYLRRVAARGAHYNGFSLFAGDATALGCYSNRGGAPRDLPPGLYGLSNHLLDTPWPKVREGKQALGRLLARDTIDPEALLELLASRATAPDDALPETGIGTEWERRLSARFVRGPEYGTRSSTALLVDDEERVRFVERAFDAAGDATGTREYAFVLGRPAL